MKDKQLAKEGEERPSSGIEIRHQMPDAEVPLAEEPLMGASRVVWGNVRGDGVDRITEALAVKVRQSLPPTSDELNLVQANKAAYRRCDIN
jgi:hypothetical protein